MKKTRFLVLVLAVAIMMMGAGYAWWNETVTVSTSITAGNLDMDVNVADVRTEIKYQIGDGAFTNVDPFNDDKNAELDVLPLTDEPDSVALNMIHLYPGSYAQAIIPIKNNGTVDVKFEGNTIPVCAFNENFSEDIAALDNCNAEMILSTSIEENTQGCITLTPKYNTTTGILVGYDVPADTKIEATHTLYLKVKFTMKNNATDASEYKTLTMQIRPNFVQFNRF